MREDFEKRMEERKMRWEMRMERHHRSGHIWTGVLLLLIGIVALMRSYIPDFPRWVFSWQMLLIVLGLFIGFRHRFQGVAWFVLLLVGGTFLANDYFLYGDLRRHIWPVILIVIGLFFIVRSQQKSGSDRNGWSGRKKNPGTDINEPLSGCQQETFTQDDFVDSTCIFSGSKKNILCKDFKGGDIVNVFGGTELNLSQADIKGTAVLELTTIFGGTKLIIPSNWAVKSEAVTIFGGLEDKRPMSQIAENPDKLLLLKGTVIFGGIDIKSY